jgi:hypothetical protein
MRGIHFALALGVSMAGAATLVDLAQKNIRLKKSEDLRNRKVELKQQRTNKLKEEQDRLEV